MICTSATRIAEFFIASSPQRLPAPQTFHFLTGSNMPQVRHPERHCQGYSLIFADSGILSGNKYCILKLCPFFHSDNRPPDYRFHLRKFQSVIGMTTAYAVDRPTRGRAPPADRRSWFYSVPGESILEKSIPRKSIPRKKHFGRNIPRKNILGKNIPGNVSTRFQTFLNISKYLVIYILSEC